MKIWFISGTHSEHLGLNIPEVDLMVHCGDQSTHGNPGLNEPQSRRFWDGFASLDIATKVLVPGNHSTAVEQGLIGADDCGMFTRGATRFINCSCCNLAAVLKNNGFVVEIQQGIVLRVDSLQSPV